MFDISDEIVRASFGMMSYLILLYIFIIISNKRKALFSANYIGMVKNLKNSYKIMMLLILLMLMTHFYESDYFSYRDIIHNYDFQHLDRNHGEHIYGYIAHFTNYNYLLFRFVVWGSSLYLTAFVFNKFEVNRYFGMYTILSMYMCIHYISRASLAMGIYFLGVYNLLEARKNKKISLMLLGWAIIISSYYFHHSMALLIVVTPVIFLPLNKKIILIAVIAVPLIIILIKKALLYVLINQSIPNEKLMHTLIRYSLRDDIVKANIKGQIRYCFEWGLYYVPFFVISKQIYKNMSYLKKYKQNYINLFKITASIVFVATTFGAMQFNNLWLFKRTLFMSTIPLVILMCGLYQEGLIRKKTIFKLISIGQLYNIFVYMYSCYGTFKI